MNDINHDLFEMDIHLNGYFYAGADALIREKRNVVDFSDQPVTINANTHASASECPNLLKFIYIWKLIFMSFDAYDHRTTSTHTSVMCIGLINFQF